jgi:hypothetical protein
MQTPPWGLSPDTFHLQSRLFPAVKAQGKKRLFTMGIYLATGPWACSHYKQRCSLPSVASSDNSRNPAGVRAAEGGVSEAKTAFFASRSSRLYDSKGVTSH